MSLNKSDTPRYTPSPTVTLRRCAPDVPRNDVGVIEFRQKPEVLYKRRLDLGTGRGIGGRDYFCPVGQPPWRGVDRKRRGTRLESEDGRGNVDLVPLKFPGRSQDVEYCWGFRPQGKPFTDSDVSS